jgi:hypothetical protein
MMCGIQCALTIYANVREILKHYEADETATKNQKVKRNRAFETFVNSKINFETYKSSMY